MLLIKERFFVEVELDGVLCNKACPSFRSSDGWIDYQAIRNYFASFGYVVGRIGRVL